MAIAHQSSCTKCWRPFTVTLPDGIIPQPIPICPRCQPKEIIMHIPADVTPEIFKGYLKAGDNYHNANELLGHLTQVTNNLHAALHRGNNLITSEVLGMLVELGNIAVTGSQAYVNKEKR